MSSSQSFPDPVFLSLLGRLARTLEVVQSNDESTPQTRQALLKATTDFKDGLSKAKALANALPGGELLIDQQNDIIAMLEDLKEAKRAQLARFSTFALSASVPATEDTVKMEVDSMASSPHD